ncbi:MAG TPA: NAD-dependent epimerase/dehydratase family protein [Longimicrobiaceae bacterium]|jgi:nucleoside-diphosphate-sugar epimerase|nr:NAD-dependent epimerase/dehydratase family protein [Longimicrobiaceae bacterium]
MTSVLVTGANGQIGTDLVAALRARHGAERVIASDLAPEPPADVADRGPYARLDVTDEARLREILDRHGVDTVYHLASLLSATGEQRPELCWEVNLLGLRNVLEAARQRGLRVFWPSSIAVFGPATPRAETPQTTLLDPRTMYGVTKVSGELLCRYYAERLDVDVRSVRFPGIVSYTAPPGGGTTDYAVAIFYGALQEGRYVCFVRPETRLPMMYMPDALRAVLGVMDAPAGAITIRTSYNLTAMSFSAEELAAEIRRRVPGFEVVYEPDYRQQIAESWPATIDDTRAREDWGWSPRFDLAAMVEDMLVHLPRQLAARGERAGPLHR